jgi:hypothetical protein
MNTIDIQRNKIIRLITLNDMNILKNKLLKYADNYDTLLDLLSVYINIYDDKLYSIDDDINKIVSFIDFKNYKHGDNIVPDITQQQIKNYQAPHEKINGIEPLNNITQYKLLMNGKTVYISPTFESTENIEQNIQLYGFFIELINLINSKMSLEKVYNIIPKQQIVLSKTDELNNIPYNLTKDVFNLPKISPTTAVAAGGNRK